MRNKLVICLGSNFEKEKNMRSAADLLRGYFPSIRFSELACTEPVGLPLSGPFLNQMAIAGTDAPVEEVRRAFKEMEASLGRTADSKRKGQVPIDIDLLRWNERIVKPADWNKEYVRLLFHSFPDGGDEDEGSEAEPEISGTGNQPVED